MMGFATVAGAADFTDSADVDHTEAVEVMTMINVINGYPDGSFRPEGNVTRAQMAKMVAYIVSGGEDVGDLYAGATAFSDCLTHWARGYIAYVNNTGIIAGVGNGRFNPDGNVTGVQAAKMLLCTLGYDQDAEGYVGTSWTVNVLSDARAAGLLDGLSSSNMSGALSRADAAQMMFNALTADMVEYASGDIVIEGEGSTITVGGSAATKVTTGSNVVGYDGERDGIVQLCEQYFEDLELNTKGTDDYERPANTWTYGTTTIGTYAAEADATYTASTEVGDIYSDLGLNATVDAADIDLFVDGESSNGAGYASSDTKGDISRRGTNKYGAQGAEMDVYYNEDAGTVTICIVNTYLAIVTDDDYTSDGDEGVLVEVLDDSGAQSGSYFLKNATYSQDDVLLVQVAGGEVQAVLGEPETADGTITRISSSDALTVGGTTYSQANTYTTGADGDVIDGQDVNKDTEVKIDEDISYVLYLDQYGNYLAIAVAEDNSESDLVYVFDAYVGTVGVTGTNRYEYGTFAQIVRMDGTVEDIVIGDTQASSPNAPATAVSDLKGDFAELSYNSSDEVYTLTEVPANTIAEDGSYAYKAVPDTVSNIKTEFAEDDARIIIDSSVYYLNDDTVYIFITKDGTKLDSVDVITGGVNYTLPTGINGKLAFASGNDAVAFVIEAPYEANNDNVIYFEDGTKYSERIANGVYTFKGFARGETAKAEFEVASVDGTDASTTTALSGFYQYTENADGYLRLTKVTYGSFTPDEDSFINNSSLKEIKNGILTFGSSDTAIVTNAAVVDVTDADNTDENTYGQNISSVTTLSRVLNNGYAVTADLFVNADNEVIGIYITKIAGNERPDDEEDVTGKYEIIGFDKKLTSGTSDTSPAEVNLDVYGDDSVVDEDAIYDWLTEQGYTASYNGTTWTLTSGYATYEYVKITVAPIYRINNVKAGNKTVDTISANKDYVNVGDTITFTLTKNDGFSGTYKNANVTGLTISGSATVTKVNNTTHTVTFTIGGTISADIETVEVTLS